MGLASGRVTSPVPCVWVCVCVCEWVCECVSVWVWKSVWDGKCNDGMTEVSARGQQGFLLGPGSRLPSRPPQGFQPMKKSLSCLSRARHIPWGWIPCPSGLFCIVYLPTCLLYFHLFAWGGLHWGGLGVLLFISVLSLVVGKKLPFYFSLFFFSLSLSLVFGNYVAFYWLSFNIIHCLDLFDYFFLQSRDRLWNRC